MPLVFLKGLRQNATGGWKEACDRDVQKLRSTRHHYEIKHDKMGVTGMRRKEIRTQTFPMPKDNIKMDLKSK